MPLQEPVRGSSGRPDPAEKTDNDRGQDRQAERERYMTTLANDKTESKRRGSITKLSAIHFLTGYYPRSEKKLDLLLNLEVPLIVRNLDPKKN